MELLRRDQTGQQQRLQGDEPHPYQHQPQQPHQPDMEKRPSSLAVLAEISCGIGGNFHKDPVVFEELWWRAEEINASLKNTSLRAG